VKEADRNSGLLVPGCESGSAAGQSLLEDLRSAEIGLRGGLLRQKPGWRGRLFDFVWLIYSVFFVIQPIQEHSRKSWIAFAVAFSVFLAIYIALVYSTSQRVRFLLLLAMTILALGYYPYNAGACGMFIYVAAFAPFVTESIAFAVGTITVACLSMVVEGWWLHLSPWSWLICALIAVAVGAGNLVAAQRMRANKRLNLAHEQIAHLAKLAERERIARDLHDVLGHTLSVVVLKSELAGKLMDRDPERARTEIGEVEQIARKALGEVREAIRGYRTEGLAAEIDRARKILDAAGVTLECEAKPPPFPPSEETVLSLIVREAVTNIVRHAQASHCRLDFQTNGHGTALVVEDDGRGGVRAEGNGLRGMRERVESLGGRLVIDSGQGTRLLVEIPPQSARS
jgi:two-component system sensor histidine kinase DesK